MIQSPFQSNRRVAVKVQATNLFYLFKPPTTFYSRTLSTTYTSSDRTDDDDDDEEHGQHERLQMTDWLRDLSS